MSEMVGRVARAIDPALCEIIDALGPTDDWPIEMLHRHYGYDRLLSRAQAAITALREPTEAMIDAGGRAMPPADTYDLPDDCPNVWRAMIDAALSE